MANRVILVTGATGGQGGSVARHLLNSGNYTVRCLTRNPDSAGAQALKRVGAQVVKGDLADPASLRAATDGCWGVFGVTNFWEHFSNEYEQGRNLIEAVAQSGVECFVFSTLYSAHRVSGGKLSVPHLDLKAQLEDETRQRGLPATFVHVAYYYENFLTFFPPQKQADGSYAFGFPQGDTPLAAVSVEDVGGIVRPVFDAPERYRGKVVGIVGDDEPPARYAEIMSRVIGKRFVYNYIPADTYAALGFPGAKELADMFEFNRLYIPSRRTDVEQCRRLYPAMQSFETWLRTHREQFVAVLK